MDPTTMILNAVNSGTALSTVSAQLMASGYSSAQLMQLYNQVAASSVATPQIVTYLQSENGRLQSQQQTQNYVLLAAIFIGGWALLSHKRRSRAAS